MTKQITRITSLLFLVLLAGAPASAAEIKLAVAANFTAPMKALQKHFEAATSHTLLISYGSSGKLYTQIKNGAPFEVFLSADAERPARLEAEKEAIAGSRFTYAIGCMVLWSPTPGLVDSRGAILKSERFKKLALANPKTAPYGAAAREVLQKLGLLEKVEPRTVQGADIGQAYQFVASGNAELGFVSLSQVLKSGEIPGSAWRVPAHLHSPIRQQAVLLNAGRGNPAAHAFLDYLKSPAARALIRDAGYTTEPDKK